MVSSKSNVSTRSGASCFDDDSDDDEKLTLFSLSIFEFSEKEEEAKHGEKLFLCRPRLLPKSLMSSRPSPLNAKKIRERLLVRRRHRLADDHEEEEEEEEDGAKEKYIFLFFPRVKKNDDSSSFSSSFSF